MKAVRTYDLFHIILHGESRDREGGREVAGGGGVVDIASRHEPIDYLFCLGKGNGINLCLFRLINEFTLESRYIARIEGATFIENHYSYKKQN